MGQRERLPRRPPKWQDRLHRMLLAHFSDIHVTVPPILMPWRSLLGKRLAGALNYYAGGRRRHFAGVEDRIRELLEDVDREGADHVLCTGDLTQMSYAEEFDRCAALFGDRLRAPDRFTVIPGNHDRYTASAARHKRFEHWFAALSEGGVFPFRKDLSASVTIIGLDVARPNSLFDSSGECGREQLARLSLLLSDASLAGRFVIVALHYGLFRKNGERDRASHGIRDLDALLGVLRGSRTDAVLHGHMHMPYQLNAQELRIVCAGSATDLHDHCGYNLYEITAADRTISVRRRRWDEERGRYVECLIASTTS